MNTWLITGGSGFVGRHVLDQLRGQPIHVVALGRKPLDRPAVRFVQADLNDATSLQHILAKFTPDVVLHLAGKTPPATIEVLDQANRIATANLLAALRALNRPVRLISTGSAAELGDVPVEHLPVAEGYPAGPETDYGRSKLAATTAVLNASSPIVPVVLRVFNPIGPGMPTSQAFGRFAHLLADGAGPLELDAGDLSPLRDFIDVRDVASSITQLAQSTASGLFHVGTGRSRSIRDGLDILAKLANRHVHLKHDPNRRNGPVDSRADITRIRSTIGWTPVIPFEQSLTDLWDSRLAWSVR